MADYKVKIIDELAFQLGTPDELCAVLAWAHDLRCRVELEYADGTKERGRVGRTTGQVNVPILVKTRRSLGGTIIGESLVVAVRSVKPDRRLGAELWRKP